ncbi:hypothetical protein ACFVIM_23615 [Streptomyces sp. NPDC057638]|uniref:hypothetical protein n=1 Tax=Streptomyces sp. NPDC057638 TaxID=3346190 RepID=UPI0036B7793D
MTLLHGRQPVRPPARLVLDTWRRAGGDGGEGQRPLRFPPFLDRGPVFPDDREGAGERLAAVEAAAVHVEAFAVGPAWPGQWAWDPPAARHRGGPPRPWPAGPMTLVLLDRLLTSSPDCSRDTARRLSELADRAEAGLDLRILSQRAVPGWNLAHGWGALCSRIALPGGHTLYVREDPGPVYEARADALDRAMAAVLDVTVTGADALAAVRHAAARHTAGPCRTWTDCPCPPFTPSPAGRPVAAAVHHRGRILLVPGPGGKPGLPVTTTTAGESADAAALRAVEQHTPHAVVTGRVAGDRPGRPLLVLCAIPHPALTTAGPGAVWADARTVPGLPPLPAPSGTEGAAPTKEYPCPT